MVSSLRIGMLRCCLCDRTDFETAGALLDHDCQDDDSGVRGDDGEGKPDGEAVLSAPV